MVLSSTKREMSQKEYNDTYLQYNHNNRNQTSQIFEKMRTPQATTTSQSYLNYTGTGNNSSNNTSNSSIQYRTGEP